MEKTRLYILSKNGTMLHPGIIDLFVKQVEKYGELEDLGFGNAYNMPMYLLGEIEGYVDSSFVVAWDMDQDVPHPRAFVGETEIMALIKALEEDENGDSWEIAVKLNKKIRTETEDPRSWNVTKTDI